MDDFPSGTNASEWATDTCGLQNSTSRHLVAHFADGMSEHHARHQCLSAIAFLQQGCIQCWLFSILRYGPSTMVPECVSRLLCAVVAVLSYTGYDMEDAMIINKSSMERGFAHGSLHKTEQVNLREDRGSSKGILAAEPADARTVCGMAVNHTSLSRALHLVVLCVWAVAHQ